MKGLDPMMGALASFVILIVGVLLFSLLTVPEVKECETNEDCIPEEPLIGVKYICENGICKTKPFGNPATEYCIEQGYEPEIRTNPDGSQTGYCVFPDGSECEEWAFYRGECQPPETECSADGDCVPAQCCHPTDCVKKELKPDCTGILCTMECAPGTMDCGQGHCACVDNKCVVVWTE